MVTCHCKTLESSTNPAEKPSIGFRVKSCLKKKKNTRENTSQRLFESCTQNTKKRKKFTLVVSSSISFSPRERERERETHTYTLARDKRKHHERQRERRNKETQRERERLHNISRGLPLSWFRNRSTAWSVIVFLYPESEFLLRRALSFLPSFTCARVVNIYKIFSSSNPSSSSSSRHDLLLVVVVLFFYIKITLSIARVRFKVTRAFVCYLNVMFFSLRVSLFFFFFFQFFFFL